MGRRALARTLRRSAVLLNSASGPGQTVRGLASGSHTGLLASRSASIRSAVDKATPAHRDALSLPRSMVSALPAEKEVSDDEAPMRVLPSDSPSGSRPEVVTDHFGAISMLCDDNEGQVSSDTDASWQAVTVTRTFCLLAPSRCKSVVQYIRYSVHSAGMLTLSLAAMPQCGAVL